ncbi:TMEM175 family protein [Amnibacterium sp.]|uniref:TMEM175 family protein n=1 Tax=Amnibacterium sp. TaxID=1872496 RepID=UPI003F7C7C29
MRTGRVEAFSDGVLAILITIMVLELPKPAGADWRALGHDVPVLLGYLLSFVYLGIYWNNHHHMFQAVRRVSGGVLWANLHLLFWLSLVPFITGWMSEEWIAETAHREAVSPVPVAAYGVVLLLAAGAYFLLQRTLIHAEGPRSRLAAAVGRDVKGKASPVLYVLGIGLSYVAPWLGVLVYAVVAAMWLIPDRRVERQVAHREDELQTEEG